MNLYRTQEEVPLSRVLKDGLQSCQQKNAPDSRQGKEEDDKGLGAARPDNMGGRAKVGRQAGCWGRAI